MAALEKSLPSWKWELSAIIVTLAGFVARCLPWRFVFSHGAVILPGVDPYYHLWRAHNLVQSFPFAPLVDPFLTFPKGGIIPWPPGFDLLIALPGILGAPASYLASWGAVLIPALGALGVWLVWLLGKKLFDHATALVAAIFAALATGFIQYSHVGRIDHHALVAPLCLAIFICFLNALQNHKHSKLWSLMGAGLAALALGSWIVTPPIYFIPVPVMLIVYALRSEMDPKPALAVKWGLVPTAVFAALVVMWAGNPQDHFSLYRPSLLHLLAYVAFAILALASLKGKKWITIAIVLSVGLAVLALLIPQLYSPIKTALQVAAGSSSAYSMAQESSPIFFPEHIFSIRRPVLLYSYFAYMWPIFIAALAIWIKKARRASPGMALVLTWSVMGLVLVLTQERFGEYAAPALFLVTAWALVSGLRLAKKALMDAPRIRRWILGSCLGISLLLALWPIGEGIAFLYYSDSVKYQRQLWDFGNDLRRALPSPLDSAGKPRWGLLTGWMDAHPLLEIAGMPVSVSSFGTRQALDGNKKSFSMLLSEDEEFVYQGMRTMHLEYLVVSNHLPQARAMASIAGLHEPIVEVTRGIDKHGRLLALTEPLPRYLRSISARAWMDDVTERGDGLAHFRLVLESSASTRRYNNPILKAFQAVPGARLQGTAEPGKLIRLRLSIQTNTSRSFTYSRKTTADKDGEFFFLVPYPTSGQRFPCRANGPYRIKIGEEVFHVNVSEKDVSTGTTLGVGN